MVNVKAMLSNYFSLKAEVKLLALKNIVHKDKDKLDFLDVCIECLAPDYQKIIVAIYKEKQSASSLAREMYLSRTTICRKRDIAINEISKHFNEFFIKDKHK